MWIILIDFLTNLLKRCVNIITIIKSRVSLIVFVFKVFLIKIFFKGLYIDFFFKQYYKWFLIF